MNGVDNTDGRVRAPIPHLSEVSLPSQLTTSGPKRFLWLKIRDVRLTLRQRIQLVCLCLLLVTCLGGSLSVLGASLLLRPLYYRDIALAHTGIEHLHSAQRLLLSLQKQPLNLERVRQAQQEFTAATLAFAQLTNDVRRLPSFAIEFPVVGDRLRAAQHLLLFVADISLAGSTGCHLLQVLISALHNPLVHQEQHGLTTKEMKVLTIDFQYIRLLVQKGFRELDQVRPGDEQFGSQIDAQLALLHQDEPQIQIWLGLLNQALPFLPDLLGVNQPAHYLVEMLDSSELRPAGGFIGNYGLLTLAGGYLANMHITDVDLLDLPFKTAGGFIPFPPAYRWFPLSHGQWSFRDSNLDADFPTSARFGLHNFQLEGDHTPIQGVISITPALIQGALEITGPLTIPEYGETITPQNLVERIHYYQLGAGRHGSSKQLSPDGLSSQRKHFTALLAEHFFNRLHHLSNADMAKFVHLLLNSFQTKDIQLYFPHPEVEALLSQAAMDDRIQQAPDGIFVVDANINGDKANTFIQSTVTDVITIDRQGNALHSVTLRSIWSLPGEVFGNPLYRDYIQVYIPANSQVQQQSGWSQSSVVHHSGFIVWAGTISLSYGETSIVMLSWMVPHAVQYDRQKNMHFQYLFQRQSGIERDLHMQINLPACAVIQHTSGATFERSEQSAWLSQPITRNLHLGIDYSCS